MYFQARLVQCWLWNPCWHAVCWLFAATSFWVTPGNTERPVLSVVENWVEGCYRIHRVKDKKDLPQYFLYLLFIFLQADSLKQSKNKECDPKAFHVQIPFCQRINLVSARLCSFNIKTQNQVQHKASDKAGCWKRVRLTMNSFSWLQKKHRTQAFFARHGGLVKMQLKDCRVFTNYLPAMAVSIYSSGGLKEDAFE